MAARPRAREVEARRSGDNTTEEDNSDNVLGARQLHSYLRPKATRDFASAEDNLNPSRPPNYLSTPRGVPSARQGSLNDTSVSGLSLYEVPSRDQLRLERQQFPNRQTRTQTVVSPEERDPSRSANPSIAQRLSRPHPQPENDYLENKFSTRAAGPPQPRGSFQSVRGNTADPSPDSNYRRTNVTNPLSSIRERSIQSDDSCVDAQTRLRSNALTSKYDSQIMRDPYSDMLRVVDEDADNFPFTVLKDRTCQRFVMIDQHQPLERYEFLRDNMYLCEEDNSAGVMSTLLRQAIDFQRMGKDHASLSCILCLALIKMASAQHRRTISLFFEALAVKGSMEYQHYATTFSALRGIVRRQAIEQRSLSQNQPVADSARHPSQEYRLAADRHDRASLNADPLISQRSETMKHPNPQANRDFFSADPRPIPSTTASFHAKRDMKAGESGMEAEEFDNSTLGQLTRDYGAEQGTYMGAHTADDAAVSRNPKVRELDPLYKARSGSWFKPGRIFALLWYEPAGSVRKEGRATDELMEPREKEKLHSGPNVSQSGDPRVPEAVFSSIRRMVVIRNSHGSCWCVPIGTYGGRGLRKAGLSSTDINAHTIIYDKRTSPSYLEREPKSNKRPIAASLTMGQSLDRASRIHLGRPHSVAWNLKVMDVGTVVREDLPALIAYVKDELFG